MQLVLIVLALILLLLVIAIPIVHAFPLERRIPTSQVWK